MKPYDKRMPLPTLLLLILGLLTTMMALPACQESPQSQAERRQELARQRLSRLQDEQRLVLMEYTLRGLSGSRDESKWQMLGDREVLYQLTAHVTAGMDLTRLRPDALTQLDDSTVLLTLPHCEVLDVRIPDSEIRNVYERVTGISSPLSAAERNRVLTAGEQRVRSTIAQMHITQEADQRAATFFRTMMMRMGYEGDRCIIAFE